MDIKAKRFNILYFVIKILFILKVLSFKIEFK
jgi:hypothetical protein